MFGAGGRQRAIDVQDAVAAREAGDIAMHVVADEGWGVPGSYAEAFDLVARNGVIEATHARELAAVIAVRSRIAHGDSSLEPGRFWEQLLAGLDLLERFVEVIASFAAPPTR